MDHVPRKRIGVQGRKEDGRFGSHPCMSCHFSHNFINIAILSRSTRGPSVRSVACKRGHRQEAAGWWPQWYDSADCQAPCESRVPAQPLASGMPSPASPGACESTTVPERAGGFWAFRANCRRRTLSPPAPGRAKSGRDSARCRPMAVTSGSWWFSCFFKVQVSS